MPAKAKEEIIKKSDTLSNVESRNAPNVVTLLYFLATMPSIRSNPLPTNATIAQPYQWFITKTKKRRDGILPSRVRTFGLVSRKSSASGLRYFSNDGFL